MSNSPLNFSLLRGSLMYLWKSNIYVAIFIHFFQFFSKYIATFISCILLHCYCTGPDYLGEPEEKGQMKENEYWEIPLPMTRHWKQVSAEERMWARGERWGSGGQRQRQLFQLGSHPLYLLLVNILAADDLVNDPVENVKNEEDEREGDSRHRVDALGAADEELAHLLHGLLRWHAGGRRIVVALDGHAVFGLQTCRAHAIGCKAEAPFTCLVLLQHTHTNIPLLLAVQMQVSSNIKCSNFLLKY